MGWTFMQRDRYLTVEQQAIREELRGCEIKGAAMVGGVLYAAVRNTCGDSPIVYGLVILTEQRGGEIGFKTMDETCGPNADKCPASILRLLTPLPQWPDGSIGYAAEWRARCATKSRINLGQEPLFS